MVIIILSENWVDVMSVVLPSIIPAACFVRAGYVEGAIGTGGEESAIGRGMMGN